jgi:ParB-like chromosome segregation protein Spo0J
MTRKDIDESAAGGNLRNWSIGATNNVRVDAIQAINRILPPTQERVDSMSHALGTRGQFTPILITKQGEKGWRVVAGATRLAAAADLGWEYIKATIVAGDERQLQLMEIEENTERHDLTADERALLKAKERELREERLEAFQEAIAEAPPTPATAKGGRGKKGGIRAAARKAGSLKPPRNGMRLNRTAVQFPASPRALQPRSSRSPI